MTKDFEKRRKELRTKYKLLKAGLVEWKNLSPETQQLLKKYYGC